MTTAEMLDLFRFNDWANARMITAILEVPEEKHGIEIASSFSSIRETLAHIASADWIWLRRWKGENPTAGPEWVNSSSTAEVVRQLGAIRDERDAFVASLSDADLERSIEYRLMSGKALRSTFAEMFRHVVNHSTYHRGQLATLLRQVGHKAAATDYILYRQQRD